MVIHPRSFLRLRPAGRACSAVFKLAALIAVLSCTARHAEAGKSATPGSSNTGANNADSEEIIIPLGGSIDLGGLGGGGSFEIPLDPAMMMPPQGGSMGFEETEEIGPDGKPHIISEKSFGGPSKRAAPVKKLTPAQAAQQKALQKEMQAMAADMTHMFSNGDFGLVPNGGARPAGNDDKYQQDLFKNAMKTFQTAEQPKSAIPAKRNQALSARTSGFPSGVDPSDDEQPHKAGGGWSVTGKNSMMNNVWIGLGSLLAVIAIGFVAFRYYKTNMMYRPVGVDAGVEQLPFRSL